MDPQKSLGLLAKAQESLALFQSTGTETARIDAHEKALQLARSLERPRDAVLKLSFSPTVLMATKVALDLNIFPTLAEATSPVPLATLATGKKQADPLLIERMLRLLAANDIVDEPAPYEYLPTAISKELTQRTSAGVVESLFLEFLPLIQKTPQYLQDINYRNPDDPMFAPLQYTHQVAIDGFNWLCQDPAALSRFNSFMEGQRANRPYWGDWFPVRERILTTGTGEEKKVLNGDSAGQPLLVDIGGGRGHDLLAFRERFPVSEAPGTLVLEDLPGVIDEAREAAAQDALGGLQGIETVPYDFFADEQPVRNARVYYFKYVLHDWSDAKAAVIFNNLKPAMKRGYSKVLIEEYILPDREAKPLPCMTDLAVMVFCSGLERTRQRWVDLLEGVVGLRILKFWVREGDGLGIIEAELPEVD